MKINGFNDFVTALLEVGFSMGGDNDEGIFSISQYYSENICAHTNISDTDPWEWRMRILEERNDIAYAKLFCGKSGWITAQWYPCFLAARRGNNSLYDQYIDGNISAYAKRIYDIVSENGIVPFDVIKKLGAFSTEDKSRFDRAIVELQRKMFITMCGRQQKTDKNGKEYGWASTVFCTIENFGNKDILEQAAKISKQEATEKLTTQIYRLNPNANSKKIARFING